MLLMAQLPGAIVASEWDFKSLYKELTTAPLSLLARGANEPDIVIDSINVTEVAGGTPTFTLRQTDSGGQALSSDATGNLITAKALTAGQLLELPVSGRALGWIYLEAGTALFGLASANDVVNIRINYRKRR